MFELTEPLQFTVLASEDDATASCHFVASKQQFHLSWANVLLPHPFDSVANR